MPTSETLAEQLNATLSANDPNSTTLERPSPGPAPAVEFKTTATDFGGSVTKVPVKPSRLYILYYRYGNIPHLSKVFEYNGDLREAILRGRHHCLSMGYTPIYVRPFIYDLDEQERMKKTDPENFKENVIR